MYNSIKGEGRVNRVKLLLRSWFVRTVVKEDSSKLTVYIIICTVT